MSEPLFIDAGHAIKWAEETASRPDVGSHLGRLIGGPRGGEPVFDVALSISARVAACDPRHTALTAKAIYGAPRPEMDMEVGRIVGGALRACAAARDKSDAQLCALGTATLKAERAWMVYKDRYPLRRMAHDCGVNHSNFIRGMAWVELRSESTATIRLWIDAVHREIGLWLTDMGWMDSAPD